MEILYNEMEVIKVNFGKLFYNEDYAEDSNLLRQALYEIAQHLGHSFETPISLSLLCLELLIPYDTARLIYSELLNLIRTSDVKELQIEHLRSIMTIHYPQAQDFNEFVVLSFFKAMVKCWLSPLDEEALEISARIKVLELK